MDLLNPQIFTKRLRGRACIHQVGLTLSRSGIARVGGAGTLRSATTSLSMSTMMNGSSLGESIPEEWLGPDVETHGEWEGCSLGLRNDNGVAKFLAPISTSSRGLGE